MTSRFRRHLVAVEIPSNEAEAVISRKGGDISSSGNPRRLRKDTKDGRSGHVVKSAAPRPLKLSKRLNDGLLRSSASRMLVAVDIPKATSDQSSQAAPTLARQLVPPERPVVLYHYTNEAGYNAINSSQSIRASTIEGRQSTHYGNGVYFSPLSPANFGMIGAHAFCTRLWNRCDAYSVDRMSYFFEVSIQGHSDAMPAVDPEYDLQVQDIWLVPGLHDLDVSRRIRSHGKTDLGRLLESMTPEELAAAAKEEDDLRNVNVRAGASSIGSVSVPTTPHTETPPAEGLRYQPRWARAGHGQI